MHFNDWYYYFGLILVPCLITVVVGGVIGYTAGNTEIGAVAGLSIAVVYFLFWVVAIIYPMWSHNKKVAAREVQRQFNENLRS